MKTTTLIKTVILSAAVLALASAQAQVSTAKIGKMEIVSINKMIIETVGDEYFLHVGLTFQNRNPEAVKLRKGVFQTRALGKRWGQTAKEAEVRTLEIGKGVLEELELPGTANKTAKGLTTAEVVIDLGPKTEATVEKMISLWNLVGNAEEQLGLLFVGSAEIGQELANGWVFEQGKKIEVELTFEPKVQRRVLLQ